MDGRILGLDLCDAYTHLVCDGGEKSWILPTVICKKKDEDLWLVGEPAYASALKGEGVMVDKLVKLVQKDGSSTICNQKYTGMQLMIQFLVRLIQLAGEEYGARQIKKLVITVPQVDARLLECLRECGDYLGVAPGGVHIVSHTESFLYYVLSQKREVWTNQVGMFDLSKDGLYYYEMKVQRGMRQNVVAAERHRQEESFDLDILASGHGGRIADTILCSCAGRLLHKKLFSSIFLTGKGFENLGWADNFMKLVCNRRKVYMEEALFARGAVYLGVDLLREKTAYPYLYLCEGRLTCGVAMKASVRGQEGQVYLARAGEVWYEAGGQVEVILDNQDYLEFVFLPLDSKKARTVRMALEGFPKRGDKTLRVQVEAGFLDERTVALTVTDQGFGEFFPSTGASIRQEVML